MGELEDQYDRDKKKSYSDSKYSTFIQREQNDPRVKMNKHQGDVFLQYQKGALSREEATDKILRHAFVMTDNIMSDSHLGENIN